MFRRRWRSVVRFGLWSTAIAIVSSQAANVTGTTWGRPPSPTVARRATRASPRRRRASSRSRSMTRRYRTGAHDDDGGLPLRPGRISSVPERQPPVLAHQVVAEAAVTLLLPELEARSLVDAAGLDQDVVGPERQTRIAGPAREPDALVHEPAADAQAAGARVDQEQAQLGDRVLPPDAEHAARRLALDLGDPAGFAGGVVTLGVVGHDPGDEGLEGLVPAVLAGVEQPMALHDPAQVARPGRPQDVGG